MRLVGARLQMRRQLGERDPFQAREQIDLAEQAGVADRIWRFAGNGLADVRLRALTLHGPPTYGDTRNYAATEAA